MMKKEFALPRNAVEILQAANRLKAVEETGLLGDRTPKFFDQTCATVLSVLNVPVAQITLLAEHEQNMKSSLGFDIDKAPTKTAFCAVTIASENDILIINDTLKDDIFHNSPFVVEPPHVRFYAGCPIVFKQEKVGTLCVYDFKPRDELPQEQIDFLRKLTKDVEEAIYGEVGYK